MKKFSFYLIYLGLFSLAVSNTSTERVLANFYLQKKGEVYFKFALNKSDNLQFLSDNLSIDKIEGGTLYAYANSGEFERFLQSGRSYITLEPPGDLTVDVKMSDYKNERPDWDAYPTYDAYVDIMTQFAADYPTLCSIEEIGESVLGRKLLVAKISDNVSVAENEPQILNTSTIHGDELAGFVTMLHMIDSLLKGYSTDGDIKILVDNTEIFICPLVNPDGAYKDGNSTVLGSVRFNSNNIDLNRDFPDPVAGWLPYDRPFQPETESFVNFELSNNFVISTDLHGGVEVVVYPWGTNWNKIASDDAWFIDVAGNYAQSARDNSPSNYWTTMQSGITSGADWYKITGGRMSYMLYFQSCRLLTLELSETKILPTSQLLNHWEYNNEAMFDFYREALYGIKGTVTDSVTGLPISWAKIFIENHDIDSSHVFTSPDLGGYFRPIEAGTYTLTFTKDEYHPQTITNVTVIDLEATLLDVQLVPLVITGVAKEYPEGAFTLGLLPGGGVILQGAALHNALSAHIYNLSGKLVSHLNGTGSLRWNSQGTAPKGLYFVKLAQGPFKTTLPFVLK